MNKKLLRDYFIELLGSFFFVLTCVAVVCVNQMTVPADQRAGTAPLTLHQPGVVGMALAQGLAWAVLVALTAPVTGGYLNPAITLTLWLFNRINTARTAWLIGAQLLGGLLAGWCIRQTFDEEVCRLAHFGAPHLNPLAYQTGPQSGVWAGLAVELILTFLLTFAILGGQEGQGAGGKSLGGPGGAWLGGAVVTVAVLVAFPLTGAALNPARWFGPVAWEALTRRSRDPFDDAFAYLAGPIVGAVLGGWWTFKIHLPGRAAK